MRDECLRCSTRKAKTKSCEPTGGAVGGKRAGALVARIHKQKKNRANDWRSWLESDQITNFLSACKLRVCL